MATITKGYKQLIAEAEAVIETLTVDQARALQAAGEALVVDLRDVREIEREGRIPGSYHAPRGMLEFWVDPDSPYHREALSTAPRLVLHCASGWRSALATKTLHDMGMTNVSHIGGGFTAWTKAGAPVEKKS